MLIRSNFSGAVALERVGRLPRTEAHIRICQTVSDVRLRLPHSGNEEILQDAASLLDGTGRCLRLYHAKVSSAETVSVRTTPRGFSMCTAENISVQLVE